MRLGIGEIIVVLALALLFFGPSKLPQLGSSLGQALKNFKKGLNSLHEDVDVSAAVQDEKKSLPTKASDSIGSKAERDLGDRVRLVLAAFVGTRQRPRLASNSRRWPRCLVHASARRCLLRFASATTHATSTGS